MISVIIPTHNGLPYVTEAIASVLQQTYTQWELLIVDDGSTDATAEVVARYARDDARVRVIRQDNRGTAAARNRAIREAHGEYFAFLDDDDRWLPQYLERQVEALRQHPEVAGAFAHARVIDGQGVATQTILGATVLPTIQTCLEGEEIWMPSQTVIRRRVIEAIGLFDETLRVTADRDLWIRVLQYGPLYHLPEVLVEYRRHGQNVSANRAAVLEDRLRVVRNVRPNPAAGLTRAYLRELLGRKHYQLAWYYLDHQGCAKGARHFLSAVLACPTIGMHVRREQPKPKWYGFLAPYLGTVVFGVRSIPEWIQKTAKPQPRMREIPVHTTR